MHDTPQLTPPCGGDLGELPVRFKQFLFQSTPPCGGDPGSDFSELGSRNFNPRPLAGATTWVLQRYNYRLDFNPRPLAGATVCRRAWMERPGFQSTPPCGGDGAVVGGLLAKPISIHAPLRGRLTSPPPKWCPILISIHAPLRGRRTRLTRSGKRTGFQSTPPCGGDYSL